MSIMSAQGIIRVIIFDALDPSGFSHLLDSDSMIGATGDPKHAGVRRKSVGNAIEKMCRRSQI